ncbi:MAG: HD domain-containing phosphohydrolase [Fimbriimonadaceae bacterium]
MIKISEDLRDMHIVVIDDEMVNLRLMQRFLEQAGMSRVTLIEGSSDIEQLATLAPDVICLDLHMPGKDGFAVLQEIRESIPALRQVPVLVLTADDSIGARQKALDLGANDFINKPGEGVEIVLRVRNFLRTRKLYKELERYSLDLESKVQLRTLELYEATEDCLWRLARASEYRDDDTGEHTIRVGVVSSRIAHVLGLDRDRVDMIRRAAPLHDIGKIGIPDSILLKPGKLTPDEYAVMRSHVKIGASLLAGSSSKLMLMAEKIALSHHEKWDGSGYSGGLSGEEIPLEGRIVAVADVFDALTHDRPYKSAWSPDKAVAEIIGQSGRHFDPKVVSAFAEVARTTIPGVAV